MKTRIRIMMMTAMVWSLGLSAAAASPGSSSVPSGISKTQWAVPTTTSTASVSATKSSQGLDFFRDWIKNFPSQPDLPQFPTPGTPDDSETPGSDASDSETPGSDASDSETGSETGIQAPQNVQVTTTYANGIRKMAFHWDAVDQATSYRIQLCISPDFEGNLAQEKTVTKNAYNTSIHSGTGFSLDTKVSYYFLVKAISGKQESDWSEVIEDKGSVNLFG